MLGSVAAILVGIWFYLSASRSGRPPVSWGISGVVVYFLAALLWTLLVTPSIKDAAAHGQSVVLVFIVRYAYVLFGIACAAAINLWLNKAGQSE